LELHERFCPVCKNKNDRNAIVCIHCGASMDLQHPGPAATTKNAERPELVGARITEAPIDNALIPEDGIAIYAAGTSKPVYLRFDRELVFGRASDEAPEETLLDLTELGGYHMGISRRHAKIRRSEDGYEIMDLASTNGSWMNDERLVPNKTYPLASGAQLRFARMRLLILYHPKAKMKSPE
jgi:hypothetical protein